MEEDINLAGLHIALTTPFDDSNKISLPLLEKHAVLLGVAWIFIISDFCPKNQIS